LKNESAIAWGLRAGYTIKDQVSIHAIFWREEPMPRPQRDDDDEDAPERPRRKPPEPTERDEAVEPAERVRKPRPRREEEYEEDDRPRARRRRYEDEEDDFEDRPRRRRRRKREAIEGLIPYHNPKSLAAYYCGVFGLIPIIGNILGPIALILGIQGIRFARKHDAGGLGHAITGVILGSFATLVYWGLTIIVVIGLINLSRLR
jgi:hypothetical protein